MARRPLVLIAFSLGAFSLTAQTIMLRDYLAAMHGSELNLALFFATWLFWVGLGALIGARCHQHLRRVPSFVILLLVYLGLASAQITAFVSFRTLFGPDHWQWIPLAHNLAGVALLNAPFSLLTGALFPLLAALYQCRATNSDGASVSRLYAIEALGAGAGGIILTTTLALSLSPLHTFTGAAACLTFGAARLAATRHPALRATTTVVTLLLALIAATPLATLVQHRLEALRWQAILPQAQLVHTFDTPHHKVHIGRLDHQHLIFTDGALLASTEADDEALLTAAFLMAQVPHAQHLLVIGHLRPDLLRALLAYPTTKVTALAHDPQLVAGVLPYYPQQDREALDDPRLHLCFADPRGLHTCAPPNHNWDLIFLDLGDPNTLQANRHFTRDFYALVATHLSPAGALITTIQAAENQLEGPQRALASALVATFASVFPCVLVTPGERPFLIAASSPRGVTLDAPTLAQRHRELAPESPVPNTFFLDLLAPDRVAWRQRSLQINAQTPINHHLHPIALFHTLRITLLQDGVDTTALARLAQTTPLPWLLFALLWLLAIRTLFLASTPPALNPSAFGAKLAIALLGASAMTLNLLLLFAVQNRLGNLMLQLGWLSAIFMLGSSLGVFLGNRIRTRHPYPHALFLLPLLAFILLCPALLNHLQGASAPMAWSLFPLCFAGAGLLCGLPLAMAIHDLGPRRNERPVVAAWLEALDHWGAALGAGILGALVLSVLGVRFVTYALAALLTSLVLTDLVTRHLPRWLHAPAWRNRFHRLHARHPRTPARGVIWTLMALLPAAFFITEPLRHPPPPPEAQLPAPNVHTGPGSLASTLDTVAFTLRHHPFIHLYGLDTTESGHGWIIVDSRDLAPPIAASSGALSLEFALRVPSHQPLPTHHTQVAALRLNAPHLHPDDQRDLVALLDALRGLSLAELLQTSTPATTSDPQAHVVAARQSLERTTKAILQAATAPLAPPQQEPPRRIAEGVVAALLLLFAGALCILRRDAALWALLAILALVAMATLLVFTSPSPTSPAQPTAAAKKAPAITEPVRQPRDRRPATQGRDIDSTRIRNLIQDGWLSDHEALHYRPLDPY